MAGCPEEKDKAAWAEAERIDDVDAYGRYQQDFPKGLYYAEAEKRIKAFEAQAQLDALESPPPSEEEPREGRASPSPKRKNTAEVYEENQAADTRNRDREPEKAKRPPVSISKGSATLGGKTYQTVRINGLTWMAENLDYEVPDSWCYDNDPANCRKYGRLYTWAAAKQACAAVGWRLPTDQEWRDMAKHFGGADDDARDGGKAAFQALVVGGNSGFSALLGGSRGTDGSFYLLGYLSGLYWSATENGSDDAWNYNFNGGSGKLLRYRSNKAVGFSCRCVQD